MRVLEMAWGDCMHARRGEGAAGDGDAEGRDGVEGACGAVVLPPPGAHAVRGER